MTERRAGEAPTSDVAAAPRSWFSLALLALVATALLVSLVGLGTWQIHRRAWKLQLIQQVDQRVHAPPVDAPPRSEWPGVDAEHDAYRHVTLTGEFMPGHRTRVKAVTELGGGYWLLEPLLRPDGTIVYVNRGFVPEDWRPSEASTRTPEQPVRITGLLRVSEPGGAFLRHNDPAAHRWYSRDIDAIAASEGLPRQQVAPYFVDTEAGPDTDPAAWPRPGLTVIRFHNSHLVYAITWYTLALMVLGWAVLVARREWRLRRNR